MVTILISIKSFIITMDIYLDNLTLLFPLLKRRGAVFGVTALPRPPAGEGAGRVRVSPRFPDDDLRSVEQVRGG